MENEKKRFFNGVDAEWVKASIKEVFLQLGALTGKAYKLGTNSFVAFSKMYAIHNIVELSRYLFFGILFMTLTIVFICLDLSNMIKWGFVSVFGTFSILFISLGLNCVSSIVIPEYHIILKVLSKIKKDD